MRKFLMIVAGICLFGALWKKEAEEDGVAIALSPLFAVFVIEVALFMLGQERRELRDA